MADFIGKIQDVNHQELTVADLTNLSAPESGFVDNFLVEGIKTINFNETFALPDVEIYDNDGIVAKSYFDDFYNKILIFPSVLNLGTVLNNITREVIIFNTYLLQDKTCITFTGINQGEVVIEGRTATPFTIENYEEEKYQVSVSPIGSPTFESSFTWIFEGSGALNNELNAPLGDEDFVSLLITGARSVFLPWQPQAGITETLTFSTDIQISINGTEQRSNIRNNPRQSFSFNILSGDTIESSLIDNTLFGWQQRVFALPVWIDQQVLNEDIEQGQTSLTIDTTVMDVRENSFASIWKSPILNEVVEINNVTSTGFNIINGTQKAYASPVIIMPVRNTNITSNISNTVYGSYQAFRRSLQFTVRDNKEVPGYILTYEYKDRAVFVDCQGLSNNEKVEEQQIARTTVDSPNGSFEVFSAYNHPRRSKPIVFYNNSKDEYIEFRKFINYLKGSLRAIWIPSFRKDLILSRDYSSGSNSLIIHNVGYDRFLSNTNKTNIHLHNDDVEYFREITNSTIISDTEEAIAIDTAFDFDIKAGKAFSFMDLFRLETDTVTIAHSSSNRSVSTLNFLEVVQ